MAHNCEKGSISMVQKEVSADDWRQGCNDLSLDRSLPRSVDFSSEDVKKNQTANQMKGGFDEDDTVASAAGKD